MDVRELQLLLRQPAGAPGPRLRDRAQGGHGDHRPVGLREVHLPALDQPAERPDPRRAPRGRHPGRGARRCTRRGTDLVALRQRVGMVFQRPNPFPKSIFDNVAYGPGAQPAGAAARPARPGRAVSPPGGAVGRGEGPARRAGHRALRADSSSGSASRGRSATSRRCC